MTNSRKKSCTYRTRKGEACRNPAIPGTNPPACWHHHQQSREFTKKKIDYYANGLSDEEHEIWLELAANPSLTEELALARVVLGRLMSRLNDPAYILLPEDLRRLAGLIFTGARTVAQLITQESGHGLDIQPWLVEALSEFSGEHEIEL